MDLLILVASKPEKAFVSEMVDGVLIERHIRDFEGAKARIFERLPELYSHLDGKILYDPDGILIGLAKVARERFDTYQVSSGEKAGIVYWLQSVSIKLGAAVAANDTLKMGYHTSINSWKLLEGLWAVNGKPMPPAGAIWAHLPSLQRKPDTLEFDAKKLFEGTVVERAKVMLELIEWLLEPIEEER